jgi:hypothetical protein
MSKKQNKTKRVIVHITEQESAFIDSLILKHALETGVLLSRSQFVRKQMHPALKVK